MSIETLNLSQREGGYTFAVDAVEPATSPLPTVKTKEAIETLLEVPVEACCDYTDDCVAEIKTNPLVTAVARAYADHRPLVLSPDVIWITILQGLSDHMEVTGDKYLHLLFGEENPPQRRISLDLSEYPKGSPESAWDELVDAATNKTHDWIAPEFRDFFEISFSTTGKHERVASRIAFLSAVKKIFYFVEGWICGFPEITLEGEVQDWRLIRKSIEKLRPFGLNWWLKKLGPICDQFVSAAEGKPDLGFWREMFSMEKSSSCHEALVTGWIGCLFPYTYRNDVPDKRNEMVVSKVPEHNWLDRFPNGIKNVLLRMNDGSTVQVMGGLLGISQDRETLALKPKAGWSVSRLNSFENLMDSIENSDRARHRVHTTDYGKWISKKMVAFYNRFAELEILGDNGKSLVRFRSVESLVEADEQPSAQRMTRLAYLPDGQVIGVIAGFLKSDPHYCSAFCIAESEDADSAEIITDDFEQLLSWMFNPEGVVLTDLPEFQTLGTLDLSVKQDLNEVYSLLRTHGENRTDFRWDHA